jgi:GNAT superfamily N-acetyltransferase
MIRMATVNDIPSLLAMGRSFFDASGYSSITSFDKESAKETFEGLISNPLAVIFVKEVAGEVVGTIAGILCPFFFNLDHLHGQEFFWWVDPDHRGNAGRELRERLEEWASERNAKSFAVAALCALNADSVSKIYARAGYAPSDITFIKGLPCQSSI